MCLFMESHLEMEFSLSKNLIPSPPLIPFIASDPAPAVSASFAGMYSPSPLTWPTSSLIYAE